MICQISSKFLNKNMTFDALCRLGIQPKLWTLCIIIYTHNTKKRCFLNLRQALESLRLDVTKTMKESMKHTTKNLKGKWTQHPLWLDMNFILGFVSFTWYLSSPLSRDGKSERQATVMRQFCQFTKFWNRTLEAHLWNKICS